MSDQPRRGLRSNAGLIGLTILALLYGVVEAFVVQVSYWDGTLGVVLGLFICAQPAANLIDAFYRSRSAYTDQSRWLTSLLNGLAMLAGIIAIIIGTTQLTQAAHAH